ncbi:hypothetical protein [Streptomyces sp. NPDC006638]|uniref:hypothetical protein n=1 Tax=Streptomyces sp. NPDC006638 TaxID=3157183 RepID=UPI0033AF85A2
MRGSKRMAAVLVTAAVLSAAGCGNSDTAADRTDTAADKADTAAGRTKGAGTGRKTAVTTEKELRTDLAAAVAAAGLKPLELRPKTERRRCPTLSGMVRTTRVPSDATVDTLFSTLKARHWKELFRTNEEDVKGGALRVGAWEVILLTGHVDAEEGDPDWDPYTSESSPITSPSFTGLLVDVQNYCDAPQGTTKVS